MADFYSGWSTPPAGAAKYRLHLTVTVTSQNVGANTSTVSWSLKLEKDRSYDGFYGYSATWNCKLDGVTKGSGAGSVPSSPWTGWSAWTLGSGTGVVVTHDADGTMDLPVYGTYVGNNSGYAPGTMTISTTMELPTIPRATQPTVSPTSGDTGDTFTIGHSPASAAFYHDVAYSINGASYVDIVTDLVGTDTSTDWTPAHSLLADSTSATAIIRVKTYDSSGGTLIGTKTVNLPLTVPAGVKPSVSSVAWADAQTSSPDIPALMGAAGRFVQGWSKLKPTVTSSGSGGSTVTDEIVTVNGRSTESTVAFDTAVALSGAVPYTAIATDSRGRNSVAFSSTVAVAAYNFPNFPTPIVTRTSDAAGLIPDPTGGYFAITPAASVSSLVFASVQKNLLEWRVRVKPVGGSYTTVKDWSADTVSGNVWTTKYVAGGSYSAALEYIVEVSVRDLFGKNGYNAAQTVVALEILVPSESVFMDWDAGNGVGLGKFRQSGNMLDVAGRIHTDDGLTVDGDATVAGNTDVTVDLSVGGDAAVAGGLAATGSITQGGAAVVDVTDVATTDAKGITEHSTDVEAIARSSDAVVLTPSNLAAVEAAGIPTNLQLDTTNSVVKLVMQTGIGKITGSGTASVSETVTFPVAFKTGTYPVVEVGYRGYRNPAGSFNPAGLSISDSLSGAGQSPSNTSFTAKLTNPSGGNLSGGYDWYYQWTAWGEPA